MEESGDNRDIGAHGKKRKKISAQEKKAIDGQHKKLEIEILCTEHLLNKLTLDDNGSYYWNSPMFRKIRESIAVINSQPDTYRPVLGDNVPAHSTASEGGEKTAIGEQQRVCGALLTVQYVKDIAMGKDISDGAESSPVLQVVSTPKMEFEESSKASHVHFTSLRVCDGNMDQMLARLSMHILPTMERDLERGKSSG